MVPHHIKCALNSHPDIGLWTDPLMKRVEWLLYQGFKEGCEKLFDIVA